MKLYIAGPLRAPTEAERDGNIARARNVAERLWQAGNFVFCPHMHTGPWDLYVQEQHIMNFGLWMIQHMDGLVLVEGWEQSDGAKAEIAEAKRRWVTVYESAAKVPGA
ncbi:hypothetical protein LCGC14_1711330 [marine sediment metagenome]|uniref:DUF4406 domain-containing protein n=1 Tax=marine sediment metagenome TaxID=412755 RepID=A0A0F9HFL5_9ZZZZ